MDRFFDKVSSKGLWDCWEWQAGKFHNGYGKFRLDGKQRGAHRVSFELAYGAIPEGMCVMHDCDNKACVNPLHLSLGTVQDNVRDRDQKGRTASGEKIGASKITSADAAAIKQDIRTYREIAEDYGIQPSSVHNIKTGKTWRDVA